MKYLNLYFTAFCLFISSSLFAQSPQQIEADLIKSFKEINDDVGKNDYEHLGNANGQFANKLKSYAEKNPTTINYPFNQLKKQPISILSSADGLFRIYSWDNEGGGTMRFFENVFQYKSGTGTIAAIDAPGPDGDNRPGYQKLYTFKANGKTYYLATTLEIGSSKDIGGGIQVFSIENNELNADMKIIKTKTGLHSQINYGYDLSKTDEKVTSEIHFDAGTQSIYVPIVLEQGKLTNKYIIYKFTGQYFERVKN